MEQYFKYAIVRAIPDPRKGEVVNIGIVVFHDQNIDVRLLPSFGKLLALDANADIAEIQNLPESLPQWTARFDTVEEKHAAIHRFGMITLSDLGTFRTTEAVPYAEHVSMLMKNLVTPRARESAPANTANRITTSLREIFRQRDILGKNNSDIRRHLVVPNFPIDPEENLFVDFALKNGSYLFTETADFRSRSKGSLDNSRIASFAAIKLLKAKRRFRIPIKAYVVYAGSGAEISPQLKLLEDYADQLIDLENRRALAKYTQTIMEAAGPNLQL